MFGAPIDAHGVAMDDFAEPDTVYQIGLPPRRIDLLTSISGVSFEDAMNGRVLAPLGGQELPFIGLEPLLVNKLASGRPKDLADAVALKEMLGRGAR